VRPGTGLTINEELGKELMGHRGMGPGDIAKVK